MCLLLIAPLADNVDEDTSIIRQVAYNYITSLDKTINFLGENVPALSKVFNIQYELAYEKVMSDRTFTQHLISYGETLDDIIKTYNSDIDDLEDFRKVVHKENPNVVSSSYEIKSGNYILVPKE